MPLPVPTWLTFRVKLCVTGGLNIAMTLRDELMVTWQFPVPLHAPDQPANTDPKDGLAFSVTLVFAAKVSEQSKPQLMPDGLDVTVPLPIPT